MFCLNSSEVHGANICAAYQSLEQQPVCCTYRRSTVGVSQKDQSVTYWCLVKCVITSGMFYRLDTGLRLSVYLNWKIT